MGVVSTMSPLLRGKEIKKEVGKVESKRLERFTNSRFFVTKELTFVKS